MSAQQRLHGPFVHSGRFGHHHIRPDVVERRSELGARGVAVDRREDTIGQADCQRRDDHAPRVVGLGQYLGHQAGTARRRRSGPSRKALRGKAFEDLGSGRVLGRVVLVPRDGHAQEELLSENDAGPRWNVPVIPG
jgi:hypothetical protein